MTEANGRGARGAVAGLVIFSLAVLVLAPMVGIRAIPLDAIFNPAAGGMDSDIFWRIRVPRVAVSFLAGAGLAISGMAFQALFRNPLATPFTLGVTSGASFGAAVYVALGFSFTMFGLSGISIFAFSGAIISILFVYGLTMARRGFSTATMLLAGVAVSFFFSSLILFMQFISDFTRTFRILRWLMGGLDVVGFSPVINMIPFVLTGCAIVVFLGRELDLMTTGEDIAASRGVEVAKIKNLIFFAASLMVGGVVAACGPIGFIGMMSPHICRLLVGPGHRRLAIASILFGGAFLTLCDTFARTIIAPAEIPAGVITALLGGPFFIWLLLRGASEKSLV